MLFRMQLLSPVLLIICPLWVGKPIRNNQERTKFCPPQIEELFINLGMMLLLQGILIRTRSTNHSSISVFGRSTFIYAIQFSLPESRLRTTERWENIAPNLPQLQLKRKKSKLVALLTFTKIFL